jgi:hypothetical protein
MEHIIEFVRNIIHEGYYEHVEEWFVEKTNPLYRCVVFGIIGFSILIAIGITANVYGFKGINFAFWIISMLAILILLLYGRYIFRVGVAGAVYGVAKSGVSGLDAGVVLLKQYYRFGLLLVMVVTGIFGLLTFINFTWVSAGFGVFGGIFLVAMHLRDPQPKKA